MHSTHNYRMQHSSVGPPKDTRLGIGVCQADKEALLLSDAARIQTVQPCESRIPSHSSSDRRSSVIALSAVTAPDRYRRDNAGAFIRRRAFFRSDGK